jgi:hypothetical protein
MRHECIKQSHAPACAATLAFATCLEAQSSWDALPAWPVGQSSWHMLREHLAAAPSSLQ